ncbi:hypothetical protein [Flavobacterium sp. 140616W15]|uniref:hypothetical protein n=1 Tax=Flavobacterium sp. 140616W15 TaxID=2478552 RepID=UPI000F0D1CFA|nr:hypothetical protein [Flavobacterium sp. 140616W15]AYN04053.1 hypothetical protein EAG11_07480 [Flavobacterium sp. 140616W15]
MKIINKYPILAEVQQLDENSILLKFVDYNRIGRNENVFVLKIIRKDIARSINLINECHLNYPTVVVDDGELTFYNGNMDESPDWGDWTSSFGLTYEKYEFELID